MLRLILSILIVFAVLKLTTFGWQDLLRHTDELLLKDKELPLRLKSHVIRLSRDIGDRSIFKYSQLSQAANYITEQFENAGLEVEFQEYILFQKPARNIVAKKPGQGKADEIIIIGAHYDTCFNPGANDNASGIAGLLELARLLTRNQHQRTIEFIAFVNEEPPFFKTRDMGSFVYAQQAKNRAEDIKATLILEMIGYYSDKPFSQRYPLFLGPFYPNRADFISVVGNFANRQLTRQIVVPFREHSQFPVSSIALFNFIPGVDFSDHWSFWQNGLPAVMITDTAFYRYRHYHSNSDTFEKLDYQRMAMVVEALEAVLFVLAE